MIRWTPAARATVLRLWPTAVGSSVIAAVLLAEHGIAASRSSVIGVAHRAGLSGHGARPPESFAATRSAIRAAKAPRRRPERLPREEVLRRDRERAARNRLRARAGGFAAPAPVPVPAPVRPIVAPEADNDTAPTSLRIPLTAASAGQCKFIADDPRDGAATCCGHPVSAGSVWCAWHRAVCTVPTRRAA